MKIDLAGKVALVTGASRGIGLEICRALAGAGAAIVGLDVLPAELEQALGGLKAAGADAEGLTADVTDPARIEELARDVFRRRGRLDILVNNAGITRDGLLIRLAAEDWAKVLAVNLTGVFNCLKACSRWMMKQKSGRIINIASVVGITGNPGQANYTAAKAGVIALTKTAARELASRGITVNAVAPGYIRTDMTEKLPAEVKEQLRARIPLERLGEPADVARAVLFLASDLAEYITGQVLVVDGGLTMA